MTRDNGHQPGGQEGDDGASTSTAQHTAASNRHGDAHDETAPLLGDESKADSRAAWWHRVPRTITSALLGSLRWLFSTLAAPGVYILACFYDDSGNFRPLYFTKRLFAPSKKQAQECIDQAEGMPSTPDEKKGRPRSKAAAHNSPDGSLAIMSESESEAATSRTPRRRGSSPKRRSHHSFEEISPARRSIRIRLNEDALAQRKNARSPSSSSTASTSTMNNNNNNNNNSSSSSSSNTHHRHPLSSSSSILASSAAMADPSGATDHSVQFKSPISPGASAALTRYPKTPAPPRPLVPRRQPSYLNLEPVGQKHHKTLVLDLDETLIHSMSKGGRMSTGHMVEVRLSTTYVGHGGQTAIGPQHPILYWVNKRPHCDDFLRRVCKWYNLVIFTASVPEYADPVIDWLEQERKFFSGRYYRQHCTFRHGAFIKDLSAVEPDLSKVMILDNSPLSYMFHQDNAIPIQGWINDPTDNDLLHLVPLLEGLQYVSDVRALLALRGGEDGQHMA